MRAEPAQLLPGDQTLRQSFQDPLSLAIGQLAIIDTSNSLCQNDNTFGPFVQGCRDEFDFTLLFEETVFSIVPSACFLTLSAYRIWRMQGKPTSVGGNLILRCSKLVSRLYSWCNGFYQVDSRNSQLTSLPYRHGLS